MNKQAKTYTIVCAIVIGFLVLYFVIGNGLNIHDNRLKIIDTGWYVSYDGQQEEFFEKLPEKIRSESLPVTYRRTLTEEDCKNENVLAFITIHSSVEAFIDEDRIYLFDQNGNTYSKSSGHNYNFITLQRDYVGKDLRVKVQYPYHTKMAISTPLFQEGNIQNIIGEFTASIMVAVIGSMFMILVGIFLLFCYFVMNHQKKLELRFFWLGCFSVSIGIWSLIETKIFLIFAENKLLLSHISFLSLKLFVLPVIYFFRGAFDKNDKYHLMRIVGICNFIDIVGTTLLQLFGILDYKETIWFTHVYGSIGLITIFLYLVRDMMKKRKQLFEKAKKRRNVLNSVGIVLVVVCVTVDAIRFYSDTNVGDSAYFSRLGILFYIILLGIELTREAFRLSEVEKKAEKLKEEAMQDTLTGFCNRLALQKDVEKIPAKEWKEWGIAMCDLNGLKYFNDHYGHSFGDSYIIISAEVIYDTFATYGKLYRIGGDEFCILLRDMKREQFEELHRKMNERMDELSKSYFEERMGVAIGYEIFDEKTDRDLFDTEKRADVAMYQRKTEMKKENAQYNRVDDEAKVVLENPMLK